MGYDLQTTIEKIKRLPAQVVSLVGRAHMSKKVAIPLFILVLVGMVTFFSKFTWADNEAKNNDLPKVEVMITVPQELTIWSTYSGRLEAIEEADVRPQVNGVIKEVLFEEGAHVEEGAPLFIIDPRPYKAELDRARAELEAAESQVKLAAIDLERVKGLLKKKFAPVSRYDAAKNTFEVAIANVSKAKANVDQAELNYEYAHVKAPISGRIGRAEITAGNFVGAGQGAPKLTSIVKTDKFYAEFDVDEQTYLAMFRSSDITKIPVKLYLNSDESYEYKGFIHSFDNQLDTSSGTIRARAVIENKDGALVPGMFMTVKLGSVEPRKVMIVKQKAVLTDQDKKYVYVVAEGGSIVYRQVELGSSVNSGRIVLSGLEQNEKVVVNSLLRVRPGMKVEPVEYDKKQSK